MVRRRFTSTAIVLTLSLLLCRPAASVQSSNSDTDAVPSLAIDLALDGRQSLPPVAPGTYSIRLQNTVPGATYSVTIGLTQFLEQPRLTGPDFPLAASDEVPSTDRNCSSALRAIELLRRTQNESEVPARHEQAREAATVCDRTAVQDALVAVTDQLTTTVQDVTVTVPADARVSLYVARGSRRWEASVSSVPRGRWQMMFGATFVPNGNEEYYVQPGNNGGFRVVQERPRGSASLTALPSVLWTWLPADQAFGNVQHGFTAGIGLSPENGLQNAALLVGYTVRYNQNLGVTFGGVLHAQKRLDGRYSPDGVLRENVGTDALHANEIRGNVFFGATFRLGRGR